VFDERIEIELSPALNTLIGGRGTGKSTIVELLRWVLDRTRPEDFAPHERRVKDDIDRRLSGSSVNGGGILGEGTTVRVVVRHGDDAIEVTRTSATLTARRLNGGSDLDVRTVIQPRIVSQRQIGEIANDPRALRREVDSTRRTSSSLGEPAARSWSGTSDRSRASAAISSAASRTG
jgi:energy-coupling factor transporter ATP-binding protein EcfA2